MGYTNYWKQHTDIPDEVWDLIRKEIEWLIEYIGEGCIEVLENNSEVIAFNGRNKNAHEDFVLKKTKTSDNFRLYDVGFCKTNRKPYDLAVWHILTYTSHLLGTNFQISRDDNDLSELTFK